ncbi:MAG: helix-turn-helix transcriptional regulator [Dorea sp.]|nr:helix-turn-helix transcriptional regulator [uncultured Dorea sp.]
MNDTEINKKMSEIMLRIKTRRESLGLSFQDLAEKTNMSRSTLQRYETGSIRNMPVDKLEDIAYALNVSPAYLMGWEDNKSMLTPEFNRDEFSENEIHEIVLYSEFIKYRRKKGN